MCCQILLSLVAHTFENYFIKAIERFFGVYIASSKHLGTRRILKSYAASQVCITVPNSPDTPHVYM